MASNKTNKPGKSGADIVKQEDVNIAVLIADSFKVRFAPLTESRPKALMQIANRPMIDYCLESLLLSGIQKTYVYCVSHSDKIRQYLKDSKWMKTTSPMVVEVLSQSSDACLDLGGALRHIEGEGLIRTDFLLLSVDVISNVPLIPILEKHRENRERLKAAAKRENLLLTLILKKCFPGHRTRCPEEELVLAIDPPTCKLLNFQLTQNKNKLRFPLDIFKSHSKVQLRYDLVDTHIAVCSADLLAHFEDNFDFKTLYDMVRDILGNQDLASNVVYCHQLDGFYAARVSNVAMYDSVSKDIVQRWTYPLVPDLNAAEGEPRHILSRHNVYKQPGVTLSKGSVLDTDVVVGTGTSFGERTHATRCVIGRHCSIGSDVQLSNAYIWDHVTIKNKCVIDTALIADGVVLNEGVKIGRGCVIGPNVVLSANVSVPDNTRLMAHPPPSDSDGFDSSDDDDSTNGKAFTPGSIAYVYKPPSRDDDESDAESLADDLWGLELHDYSEDEEEEDLNNEDLECEIDIDDSNPVVFHREVCESMERGFRERISADNLVLEINSSKFAYNVTMEQLITSVLQSILALPGVVSQAAIATPASYYAALKPVVSHTVKVLKNFLKSNESKLQCLHAIEDFAVGHSYCSLAIGKILAQLYQEDILDEEIILSWYKNPPNDPAAKDTVRKAAAPFIQWLREADEESDEESD